MQLQHIGKVRRNVQEPEIIPYGHNFVEREHRAYHEVFGLLSDEPRPMGISNLKVELNLNSTSTNYAIGLFLSYFEKTLSSGQQLINSSSLSVFYYFKIYEIL